MACEGDIIYFSWRDERYFGDSILSPVRDQVDVGVGSCHHHSAGAVLEMQTWMKLQREGRGQERKKIDIVNMYKRYRQYRRSNDLEENSSTKQLLLWLKANVSLAEDGFEAFKLDGFEELQPLDVNGILTKMLQFLVNEGPFIGVFFIKSDFDGYGRKEIYLCDGQILTYNGGPNWIRRLRHAVVVVGFGIDRNLNPFWEYLESCGPNRSTFKKDGFDRVIFTGFDKAYLLHV